MTAPEPAGPETARQYVGRLLHAVLADVAAAEADLGHCYDGRELHPGTPEYAAGYAEYLAAEAAAADPETGPVPFTLTPQAEALLAEAGEPEPEAELEWDSADSNAYQARVEAGLELEAELEAEYDAEAAEYDVEPEAGL